MKIIQYREFAKDYEHRGLFNEAEMIKGIEWNTFNSEITDKCIRITNRRLNNNRPKSDIEDIIFFDYILHLNNFMSGMRDNFDKVYEYLKGDRKQFVDEIILKEIREGY